MMELVLDTKKRYTYADYLTWLDDKRRELLDGFIRLLVPAPKPIHQEIGLTIGSSLFNIIKGHKGKCKVFIAPFDVRLPQNGENENDKIYTVVQPDICVICDLSKVDDKGCLGAPDFIAEILSASSTKYDTGIKFDLYEKAGVKEYWIITPRDAVQVFILQEDGKYDHGTLYDEGKIPVKTLGGAEMDAGEILGFN
jgi:Uma2 family endonuclease